MEGADDGSARMRFTATDEHRNQAGTLHGGVLAALVDTAMGGRGRCHRRRRRPGHEAADRHPLRPGKPGPLRVTAKVRTRGEHLTVREADDEQDDRSLVHAVATFALLHS